MAISYVRLCSCCGEAIVDDSSTILQVSHREDCSRTISGRITRRDDYCLCGDCISSEMTDAMRRALKL